MLRRVAANLVRPVEGEEGGAAASKELAIGTVQVQVLMFLVLLFMWLFGVSVVCQKGLYWL